VLRLALQGLRGRKGPFAGAFVALLLAAALVMACGSLLESGLRSDPPVERYAGAPLVLAGEQRAVVDEGTENEDAVPLFERARLEASLVAGAAAVPGVAKAIADVITPARLYGSRGAIEAPDGRPTAVHPWPAAALTPFRLTAGRPPAAGDELVVDAASAAHGRLAVGSRVRLASTGAARRMTVVGIASAAGAPGEGVLFVTPAESGRLATVEGRVDAIGIMLEPSADADAVTAGLERLLGSDGEVVAGADRGAVEHLESAEAKEAVISIGGTFGGLALAIAMFVVASTIGLSVLQREREVALLRAVAATPRQIRRMIGWETTIVAIVASACGLLPGAALAHVLGGALSDHGVAPEAMVVHTGWLPALAAVASCVLTATVAVAAAGRRAARVKPVRAMRESASEPRLIGPLRLLAGALALAGAGAVLIIVLAGDDPLAAADAAVGVAAALVAATVLLGPLVARLIATLVTPLVRRSPSGSLAVSNLRTSSRRFSSAMTPLVLTVALTCTMVFVATTRGHIAAEQTRDRVTAELVLESGDAGVPGAAVTAIRATPGVRAAVGLTPTTLGPSLGATYRTLPAMVADPAGLDQVLDVDVRAGSLAALRNDEIAISRYQSRSGDVRLGDRVTAMLGDGHARRVRIAAVYERGLGFGDVVIPRAAAAGHLTNPLASTVLVDVAAGVAPAEVAQRLQRLTARYPGLTIGDRDDLSARADANRAANDWLFRILAAIVFAFTAVSVVNTMAMIAVHRTRELGLLRLIGSTPRQVRAMARWEATFIAGTGIAIGGLIAFITLGPTSSALGGSAIPYAPPALLALVLGSAAVVGVAGNQVATRIAMRRPPVAAIGLQD
jgi:putative ABC transport system permease protein